MQVNQEIIYWDGNLITNMKMLKFSDKFVLFLWLNYIFYIVLFIWLKVWIYINQITLIADKIDDDDDDIESDDDDEFGESKVRNSRTIKEKSQSNLKIRLNF